MGMRTVLRFYQRKMHTMLILGIESSCDESAVALVEVQDTAQLPRLLGHTLNSQIPLHQAYGGVVPELASRDHVRWLLPLLTNLLNQTNRHIEQVDALAYTKGPGLAGALLVGAGVANGLALALDKPIMGIHHLEGHLLSPFLSEDVPKFPFLALLVSGGHTQLMQVRAVGDYRLLGESVDDAAGEAFDKSAKLLGIDYPGGSELSNWAQRGNPSAYALPRPLLHADNFDFSFAGLKTAVLTHVTKLRVEYGPELPQQVKYDVAASTQEAIVEVLVKKTLKAVQSTGLERVVIAGGVGANRRLRSALGQACAQRGVSLHFPDLAYCTDNGAMIAMAAALRVQSGCQLPSRDYDFSVNPRWDLVAG